MALGAEGTRGGRSLRCAHALLRRLGPQPLRRTRRLDSRGDAALPRRPPAGAGGRESRARLRAQADAGAAAAARSAAAAVPPATRPSAPASFWPRPCPSSRSSSTTQAPRRTRSATTRIARSSSRACRAHRGRRRRSSAWPGHASHAPTALRTTPGTYRTRWLRLPRGCWPRPWPASTFSSGDGDPFCVRRRSSCQSPPLPSCSSPSAPARYSPRSSSSGRSPSSLCAWRSPDGCHGQAPWQWPSRRC